MNPYFHCTRLWVARALLLVALIAGASSAVAANFPALGNGEHHPGKMIWADLVTPDLATARDFYGTLFGWTFQSIGNAGDYVVAFIERQPVAGLLQRSLNDEQHHSAWLGFFSARDVDVAERAATSHGARTLYAPRSYAGRGRQVVLADPQGAVFAILASSSGDPPDRLAGDGEWIWSSLLTTDPGQDANFYGDVLGYRIFALPNENGVAHRVLASDGYARAGVHTLPVGHHPHWLHFVRVDDAGVSAAKATALGGRVLVEPRMDRHGGRIAVIADRSGAAIGVMEWPKDVPVAPESR